MECSKHLNYSPLHEYHSLEEAVAPLNEVVSMPFEVTRECADKVLYHEIRTCIKLLQSSRENLDCYRTFQQRNKNLCSVTRWLCLGVTNSVVLLGTTAAILYLVKRIHQLTAPLLQPLSQAVQQRDAFLANYTAILDHLRDVNVIMSTCFSKFFIDFAYNCSKISTVIPSGCDISSPSGVLLCLLRAVCESVQNSIGFCHNETMCKISKEELACYDQAVSRIPETIANFTGQHADEKATYEESVARIQTKIDSYRSEFTIGTSSLISFFIFTCVISLGYMLYLAISRKRSLDDYNGSHKLDECLKGEHMNRIINLASQLEIRLPGISIENLIEQLHSKNVEIQEKEALFELYKLVLEERLDRDIFKIIVKEVRALQATSHKVDVKVIESTD